MDIIRLYNDYGIQYITEGHKRARDGWVQIHCPFCAGSKGYHLGFNMEKEYYSCYRCGYHSIYEVIGQLLHIRGHAIYKVLDQYQGFTHVIKKRTKVHKKLILPSGIIDLQKPHKLYLESRNFDPDYLIKYYQIKGTGRVSKLGIHDFSKRIFVPIFWKGQMVSFLARNLSKDGIRYKVCPKEYEMLNNKKTLYGASDHWTDSILLVEGVTDVWRMGLKSAATYGIEYTAHQRRLLKRFKRVHIAFDPEPQAQKQALKLKADLEIMHGIEAVNHILPCDPGDLSPDDALHFIRGLNF